MAAWWLLAETILVLMLEWSSRHVRGPRPAKIVSVSSLIIFSAAMAGWAALAARQHWIYGSGDPTPENRILSMMIWNGLCTLWVVLETAILVYLARTVRGLEGSIDRSDRGTILLVGASVILFLGFTAYHAAVDSMRSAEMSPLASMRAEHLLLFYIRICGAFWVALEAACAWCVYRGRLVFLRKIS